MKKQKKASAPPRLMPFFARRIGLVLLGLWLLCMSLLTVGTAQYVLQQIVDSGYQFPERVSMVGRLDEYYPTDETARGNTFRRQHGGDDYCMLEAITQISSSVSTPDLYYIYGEKPWFEGIYRSKSHTLDTAVLFFDKTGQLLRQNGDFLYFYYANEATWAAQQMSADGYGWVDLSVEEDARYTLLRSTYTGIHSLTDWECLRMTGYFDDARFEPLSMALLTYWGMADALETLNPPSKTETALISSGDSPTYAGTSDSGSGSEYSAAQLDAMGLLEWEELYNSTATAADGKELVTIYAMRPEMMLYDGEPVRYQGQQYRDLATLLSEMEEYRSEGSVDFFNRASQVSLWNAVIFSSWRFWDFSDYDFTDFNQPWPETKLHMMTATHACPMAIAASYLRNIYLITAAITLIAFLALRRALRDQVHFPLQQITYGIENNWAYLPLLQDDPPKLAETKTLFQQYQRTKQQLFVQKNEQTRLQTALNYAHTAEENRRQMTSHIAHELKTPLAVIHSYAEGLQEHIAEEKREKYLQVILSESERMDAMVLEMLDLSRLEAGRVKLARDDFSLLRLTESVFDTLAMALDAKELRLSYSCYYDAMVTADEGRIRQVIENFATNAIKHTPFGGEIRIRIFTDRQGTVFSMENDGKNLPRAVLDKVWDSFYREDESRSSPGTGLGLAIAKNIITLHGGECRAANTDHGVEFRFRI